MDDACSDTDLGDTLATISAGCRGVDLLSRLACKTDEQPTRLLNEASSKEQTSRLDITGVFMDEGGIKEEWIDDLFLIDSIPPVSSSPRRPADS